MPAKPEGDAERGDEEQPFVSHLIELRSRLLRGIAAVVVIFMGLSVYADAGSCRERGRKFANRYGLRVSRERCRCSRAASSRVSRRAVSRIQRNWCA